MNNIKPPTFYSQVFFNHIELCGITLSVFISTPQRRDTTDISSKILARVPQHTKTWAFHSKHQRKHSYDLKSSRRLQLIRLNRPTRLLTCILSGAKPLLFQLPMRGHTALLHQTKRHERHPLVPRFFFNTTTGRNQHVHQHWVKCICPRPFPRPPFDIRLFSTIIS